MRDPYTVLGVQKSADAEEIKRAFRKLAKAYHPDRNRNDPRAQERFAEVNSAYEIIGDDKKRRAFDAGEIDAEGKPRAPFGAGTGFDTGNFHAGPGGFRFDFGAGGPSGGRGDPRDAFSDIFRQFSEGTRAAPRGRGRQRESAIPPGEDVAIDSFVTLEDVARGGTSRISLPDGRRVEVKIPQGVANGATMRLKGQGMTSPFGGPSGDALVTIHYAPHARFVVEGADLRANVPVPIRDAVLGGAVRVPTLSGEAEVTVPAWTSSGKTLRLRGKGLPLKERTGDILVTLMIDLGPNDAEIEGFFRRRKG